MRISGSLKRSIVILLAVLSFSISFAQSNKGPGGVGNNNGAGTLRGWWRGDAGITATGSNITTWADQSGWSNNLVQGTTGRFPTTVTSTNLNSQLAVKYSGAQFFNSTFSGPGVDQFTLFLVANGSSYQSLFRFQNDGSIFVVYPWEVGGGRTFLVSTDGGTGGGQASGLVTNTNNVGVARYRRNTTNGFQTFLNGATFQQRNSVNVAVPTQPFYSGVYNPGTSEFPNAEVGEMIMYYGAVNDAQLIIIQNYLAAKYNVTMGANDVYTMDNNANGDFDFDVAGIGRVNSTNINSDAQGTGIVRIQNATGLGDGEYLMWGRNNGATTVTNTSDIPAGTSARLARTWRASETGEVGNIDVDFDLTGITEFTSLNTIDIASRLRLLVDTDNDGVFNDEYPIFGAANAGGSVFRFSGVSTINNGTRFTIAMGSARTFYSLGSGAWEDNTKWSLSADGSTGAVPAGVYPSRLDNVVINTGHTITANSVSDNGSPGVRPDDMGQGNIGPFGSSNLAMFYQLGNIIIRGTFSISGIEAMIGGYTWVQGGGTLTASSNLVVTGNLQADAASTLTTLDDIILTGFSTTIINTASTSSDDLIIDHTDATLCGTGTTTLQNGAGSTITYANGGTINQICTTYQVNCTGTGCSGFPVNGTTVVISGNTGPGGVGSSTGDSQLKAWYRPESGINVTGSNVNSWTNSAGVTALDMSETAAQRPTLVLNALNGFSEVSFNGSNRLRTGLTLSASNFVADQATTFTVNRADNTTQQSCVYETDPLDGNRFSNHIPWAGTVYFDIGTCCNNDARLDVSGLTNLNQYSIWSYEADNTNGKTLYRNGTSLQNRALSSTFNTYSTHRFNLGGNTTGSAGYEGDIAEVILYTTKINSAERLIVENYLSAKYAIAVATDMYAYDSPGNGNYDFEVAGIARVSSSSYHKDAQGTGPVRIWGASGLANNEYLMFGHNAFPYTTTTTAVGTAVDGTVIKERLTQVWAVQESAGDVGTLFISFETTALNGNFVGSNLRLLIDRDNDGFQDNDVAPISGAFSNNRIIFSGVNLQTGDKFTLGNTSSTQILPIRLSEFNAVARQNDVLVTWATLTETNNHHFEVERSVDGEHWLLIGERDGFGEGISTEKHDYDFTDIAPVKGKSYYRLKQVDFNGDYSISDVRSVQFDHDVITIWPNPSDDGIFHFTMKDALIEVINIEGKKILTSKADLTNTGLDLSAQPAGVYILKIYNEDGVYFHRLVKK